MKNFKIRNLILVLAFIFGMESHASLIVNGSFEDATIDPGTGFISVGVGNNSLTGWTITQDDVHYVGDFWEASDGIHSIDLDGVIGSAGVIEQTFLTTPGETYRVSFDLAGNPDTDPRSGSPIKPMRISADGQSAEFTFDVTGQTLSNMGWIPQIWGFVADDTSATLEFRSLTTISGWGVALDNINVNAVPIPATAWLFSSGLIGLVGIARRKKAA